MIANKAINTHEKVRNLQNRLYLTAKADRKRKFYAMYDKIYRKDILEDAWKRVKQNGGAGVVGRPAAGRDRGSGIGRFQSGAGKPSRTSVESAL